MSIHPTAIIDSAASLADDVQVGPYSVIGPEVTIGAGTVIGPHVVLRGPTAIGRDNRIYQFASIGEASQAKGGDQESNTRLEIGDRNTIREYATINRGSPEGGYVTRVGNDNWLMAYTHLAHDCQLGSHIIFSNNASCAGHVEVGDHAILSGFAIIHQFSKIGEHAFVGMGAGVNKDVPPYFVAFGHPAKAVNVNKEGLKRRQFESETVQSITRAYRLLYRSGRPRQEVLQQLTELSQTEPAVQNIIDFIHASDRGIIGG